uniref:Uncharacterized protein n=1 Tax=Arundo donax TaxID=35708 RepID=A0A0A8XNW7_ARUDO
MHSRMKFISGYIVIRFEKKHDCYEESLKFPGGMRKNKQASHKIVHLYFLCRMQMFEIYIYETPSRHKYMSF